MKFYIDLHKCVGAGVCAIAAPEVFDQNDNDGIIVVLDPSPSPDQEAAVRDAAVRCPAVVIKLTKQLSSRQLPGPPGW